MNYQCVWCELFKCWQLALAFKRVGCPLHVRDMTYTCVQQRPIHHMLCHIHTWYDVSHVHMRHASFMCLTWLIFCAWSSVNRIFIYLLTKAPVCSKMTPIYPRLTALGWRPACCSCNFASRLCDWMYYCHRSECAMTIVLVKTHLNWSHVWILSSWHSSRMRIPDAGGQGTASVCVCVCVMEKEIQRDRDRRSTRERDRVFVRA